MKHNNINDIITCNNRPFIKLINSKLVSSKILFIWVKILNPPKLIIIIHKSSLDSYWFVINEFKPVVTSNKPWIKELLGKNL